MSLKKFKTFNHACTFYKFCNSQKIPRHLKDQLLRASSSIALNLAEGSGKPTPKDQRKFYAIANGSYKECEAIFILSDINTTQIDDTMKQLGACLHKLTRAP